MEIKIIVCLLLSVTILGIFGEDRIKSQYADGINENETLIIVAHILSDAGKIEVYDNDNKVWKSYYDVENCAEHFAVAVFDDNLLFIGGWSERTVINEVRSLNLKTKKVRSLPPMKKNRRESSATTIDDLVYVCGGWDEHHEVLNSVEVWNPYSFSWKLLNPMMIKRYNHASVTWNGKLYVFGGSNSAGKELDSAEVYDPKTNQWSNIANMNVKLSGLTATVLNNEIYVMNGHNSIVYDPIKNSWSGSVRLPETLVGLSAAAMNGTIYMSGGYMSDKVYQLDADEWKVHSVLTKARWSHTMLTVPNGWVDFGK